MCQDLQHGGRRCPHDTNNERQKRRDIERLKNEYIDEVQPSTNFVEPPRKLFHTTVTLEKVLKHVEETKEMVNFVNSFNQNSGSFTYETDGTLSTVLPFREERIFASTYSELEKLVHREVEKNVTLAGANIVQLAEKESFSSTDLRESFSDKREENLDLLDKFENNFNKKLSLLKKKLSETYNTKTSSLVQSLDADSEKFDKKGYVQQFPSQMETYLKFLPELEANQLTVLYQNYMDSQNEFLAVRTKIVTEIDYSSSQYAEKYSKHLSALTTVLSKVRKFGGVIEYDTHVSRAPEAEQSLQYAAKIIPSDWIKLSNESNMLNPMVVESSKTRSNYIDFKDVSAPFPVIRNKKVMVKSLDYVPTVEDNRDGVWLKADENGFVDNPYSADTPVKVDKPVVGHNVWVNFDAQEFNMMRHSHKKDEDGKIVPEGKGWVYGEYQVPVLLDNGEAGWKSKKGWRNIQKTVEQRKLQPRLTIHPKASQYHEDKGFVIAVHEFSHRVENVVPGVRKMEKAFFERRINVDGKIAESKSLSELRPNEGYSKDESVYVNTFVNDYMGKTYKEGNYELLSMGMETIFGGTNGGFIGVGSSNAGKVEYREDSDMKNFVIGLLATT